MFSVKQKREISEAIQAVLRETNHPELPDTEIQFNIHINGAEEWSWADISNNGAAQNPGVNMHNERQDSVDTHTCGIACLILGCSKCDGYADDAMFLAHYQRHDNTA